MTIQDSTTFAKVPATQCACCAQPLSTGFGYDVPFIGAVGPKCVKKFGPLVQALEAATSPLPKGSGQAQWRALNQLLGTLTRLGFSDVHVLDNGNGTVSIMTGRWKRSKTPVMQTFAQRRAQFERDLQIAQGPLALSGTAA